MNEPTSLSLLGDPTLPSSTRHDFDGRGGDHAEAHNLYGLLMNRAGSEGLCEARPERRPFIVSRSGWAGMQRWAWNWTGDAASTWESMRQQVATVVGLGLSGVAYWVRHRRVSAASDDELYLRWLQMSVFMPTAARIGAGVAPRAWCSPSRTCGMAAGWIRFRYRLLPIVHAGPPRLGHGRAHLIRPLWWSGDRRSAALDVDDAFLLGDALLVAPVTEPARADAPPRCRPGAGSACGETDASTVGSSRPRSSGSRSA